MEARGVPEEATTSDENDLAHRLRRWLRAAWAVWLAHGQDGRGLFYEQMSYDGRPDPDSPRRVLVQGRQLFAVARAAAWGVPGANAALRSGFAAVAAHAWGVDGAPGWIHVLGPDGAPRDRRRDTYDQSFLLFGLAEALRGGLPEARSLGAQTWRFMESLHDPVHGGFLEGRPAGLPRRSNPHMHLLEAALAWFDVAGERHHLDRANTIASLFADRFFDHAHSTLAEYFDDRLVRLPDTRGDSVEPGHMFEWSWLLHRLAQAGGMDLRNAAAAMHHWAMAHGCDASGFAIDEVDRHGGVRRATRRAWPQTELIKSALANGDRAVAIRVAVSFLETYLATNIDGLWIDQFGVSAEPIACVVPASTFYHIIVAFEELLAHLPAGDHVTRNG